MQTFWQKLWQQKTLILMVLPGVVLVFIFRYIPIYGILIAFKDYKASLGVWGSEWADPILSHFIRFFKNVNSKQIIWNTFRVGIATLAFSFPAPIIFALLLNEIKVNWYKRTVQTVSYIPHFISVVVVVSMLNGFCSVNGLFNDIREWFGLARIDMNNGSKYFLPMYVGSAVWQGIGWGSILYLSALSNIDISLYDVANIDGANRLQKMQHIAWPAILPTVSVLLILNAGSILNTDFTKILLMQNDTNRSQLEVISTFVFHEGIERGRFEYATAVNLFISVIAFMLVYGTNAVVRKISPENNLW